MASKYKATVEIERWKEHVCLGCGSTFRYPLKRSYSQEAHTQEAAELLARRAVMRSLETDVESKPCPTCGMTTAFAWFVRGSIDRSWKANPAGALFALVSGPLIGWLVWSAFRNEPVGFRTVSGPLITLVMAGLLFSLAFWLVRLIVSPAVLTGSGEMPLPWPG